MSKRRFDGLEDVETGTLSVDEVNSDILPASDNTYHLGNSSKRWKIESPQMTNPVSVGATLNGVTSAQGSVFVNDSGSGKSLTMGNSSNTTNIIAATLSKTQNINIDTGSAAPLNIGFYQPLRDPQTAPTFTSTNNAGGNIQGVVKYAYTFYSDGLGETTLSPLSATSSLLTNAKNTVTVPVDTDQFPTGRKLYRTKSGAGTPYYLITTIADNTTTSYADNTADSELVTEPLTYNSTVEIL